MSGDTAAPSRTTAELKARDAMWTVTAIDPIAAPLAARLVRRRVVTPNRLTLASALVAVGAGTAFALDQLVLGAIVYQLAFLLDCMDGKLAKLRGTESPLGGWFDVIGDTVRLIACSVGLMVALHDESRLAAPILMAYVSLRYGVLMVAEARGSPPRLATIAVRADFLAVLRAAPRRSAPPGTTVDAETLVFTLGPLAGLPVVAAAVAAAVELAHLLAYIVQAVRAERDRPHG